MRASLSAPGLFVPVERDGRVLVDGGVADNLPIDVARTMDVDVLIVVNVGAPLFARDRLGSATAISNQMLSILIRRDATRQLETLAAVGYPHQPTSWATPHRLTSESCPGRWLPVPTRRRT